MAVLRATIIRFCVALAISFIALTIEDQLPWLKQFFLIQNVCFVLTCTFGPLFIDAAKLILAGQGKFSYPHVRFAAAIVLGARVGLVGLAWQSISYLPTVEAVMNDNMGLLCRAGPETAWSQARQLVPQLQWLGACKNFSDGMLDCAIVFCCYFGHAIAAL